MKIELPPILAPTESAAVSPGADEPVCFHCGTPCGGAAGWHAGQAFCCHGCRTVFELLAESGLGHFYDLGKQAGIRIKTATREDQCRHLDDPAVRERLVDFADDRTCRVTLRIPAIHCVACVWLLENLFRLHPAIGRTEVNFPRREAAVTFDPARLKLSGLVALLSSLGYEPVFNLADWGTSSAPSAPRRLWLQLGVAGFAFGNVMMLSLPGYLGLESAGNPALARFLGIVSLGLALPVVFYSAADYWRSAWQCLRQRTLTIELPLAIGMAALFGQSLYEIARGLGPGYLDSLTGLVFFLLCGRLFQQKTYDQLSFDRDYQSFFPLSVVRQTAQGETTVALARLRVGDRLRLRHGELIPADARLVSGPALIDYSFVTGESEPVARQPGDYLYAGGQQTGAAIVVEIVKPVSQSYLTSLWSHAAFTKTRTPTLQTLTNRLSRGFMVGLAAVALSTAAYWALTNPALTWWTFTAVLIVACPCALALAAPFALGTAQRWLARQNVFLKNPQVLETLARVEAIVFDKTGTLTAPRQAAVTWTGGQLSADEAADVAALAGHSTHPLAREISETWKARRAGNGGEQETGPITDFQEHPGRGLAGRRRHRRIQLGSARWLREWGVTVPADFPETEAPAGATVHCALDGVYRGHYRIISRLRPRTDDLIGGLAPRFDLALLSGDNERERQTFRTLFGERAGLHFNQTPLGKLDFIRRLQQTGKTTMMVGDGLNDAGALRQSDVGVAVVEQIGAFSPASDVILEASQVGRLPALLRFARLAVGVVYVSFGLSVIYNGVGISFAARGVLSPLVAAVLMPLSSVSVVAFACGATIWAARRCGFTGSGGGPA